ncbi:MAG TPA: ADP-ribosylglycohydrolase family protein [Steroidobacteraceae bacterium]|nr:ADP-ribosylglycohydrolase family protein [Steroidobacteraceae bacterium]
MNASAPEPPPALPLGNCYWVLPGRVLAGEHPASANPELSAQRLQALQEAGVGCFIDLTGPQESTEYAQALAPGTAYHRFGIPDHGVPQSPALMARVLDTVHAAVRTGTTVYVHCRAGIGRTGLVAGCLLAESGFAAEAAIEELNRLWQASARSRQWASIPETEEQSAYVRQWRRTPAEPDPLQDPRIIAAARGLRARFQGTLLGLATGDALGVSTQYRRPGRFAPLGDMIGGGPFDLPRGAWSDDTAMALCLAESLLESGGFEARDQVERYRRWQSQGHLSATGQCVGITAGTTRALGRAQWRRQAFSGSHDPQALDPEVLCRVPAVVLYYFADREQAATQAAEAARTTCQVPQVLTACRALAYALHAALSGGSRTEILGAAQALIGDTSRPQALGQEGSAPAALAVALDAFASTGSFREAVLKAANLGGASDVVAGVAGALAGAHYTQGAIPTMWRNGLMRLDLLEGFADRLLAHVLLEFGR